MLGVALRELAYRILTVVSHSSSRGFSGGEIVVA
jgi:hypothetical protein